MTTVYGVTLDDYDSCGPSELFTTEALAIARAEQLTTDTARYLVEPYEIEDRLPERITVHNFAMTIYRDGTPTKIATAESEWWDNNLPTMLNKVEGGRQAYVHVWHRDPAEAERICRAEAAEIVTSWPAA